MMFFSTRDAEKKLFKASEVIKQGLASDGGLFVPDSIPSLSLDEIKALADKYTRSLHIDNVRIDHDLGFIVWCSYGNAFRLTGDETYKPMIEDAAEFDEIVDEEQKEHPEWNFIVDCKLPENGQLVLVSIDIAGHERVQFDEFYDDDGVYLDSGYEIGEEAVAWMPLPKAYKNEGSDE